MRHWILNGERRPIRDALPTVAVAGSVCLVVLLGLVYVWKIHDLNIGNLTRDAADSLRGPWYTAAIANFGFALWAATAGICLVAAAVLRSIEGQLEATMFFLAGGLLSAMLLADDMLLLHDRLFPAFLGLHENITYGAYMVLTAAYLFAFRKLILRRTDVLILVVSIVGFAGGLGGDVVMGGGGDTSSKFLLEDGPKFCGLVMWAAYHAKTAVLFISNALHQPPMMSRGTIST